MFCCSRDLATKVQVLSSVEARDLWAEVRLGCKLHTGNRKQGGEGGCQVWEQFMLFLDGIPPPKVAEFKSEVELSSEVARLSPARLVSPGRAPLGEYRSKIPAKQLLKTL